MATVHQKWQGDFIDLGNVGESSVRSGYVVRDAPDEWSAWVALNLATITPPEGIAIGGERIVRQKVRITDRIGATSWEGEVQWGSRQSVGEMIQQDGFRWQFETGGGNQSVEYSLGTRAYSGSGQQPWNLRTMASVDAGVREFHWSETWEFPAETITFAYANVAYLLTWTMNAAPFRGFDVGEVLFQGISGGKQNTDSVQLTYKFAAQPNRGEELGKPNIVIDGTVITKKYGWEAIEPLTEQQPTTESGSGDSVRVRLHPVAATVLVHQVYEFGDYSALLIGD